MQENLTPMDSEAWAELHTLRLTVKGPDGFATWQDAAVAERVRRVKAEQEMAPLLAASRYTCDLCTQALDTVREQEVEIAALRGALQAMLAEFNEQMTGEATDCTALDVLMEAVHYEIKQTINGAPMIRDNIIKRLEPLISMLEEGMINEIH